MRATDSNHGCAPQCGSSTGVNAGWAATLQVVAARPTATVAHLRTAAANGDPDAVAEITRRQLEPERLAA